MLRIWGGSRTPQLNPFRVHTLSGTGSETTKVIGANYSPKSRSLSIDHEARAHASRETTGGGLQAWLGSRVVPGLARARDTSGAKLRVRVGSTSVFVILGGCRMVQESNE